MKNNIFYMKVTDRNGRIRKMWVTTEKETLTPEEANIEISKRSGKHEWNPRNIKKVSKVFEN